MTLQKVKCIANSCYFLSPSQPFTWDPATPSGSTHALPILSPLTLAASTRVDSHFSPSFLSSLSLALHCHTLKVTLHHHPISHRDGAERSKFKGYRVVPYSNKTTSHPRSRPQELMKLCVKDVEVMLKMAKQSAMQLVIDGVYSLDFVDLRDLLWRKAVSPSHLTLSVKTSHSSTTGSCFNLSAAVPEVTVSVGVEPSAVKLSQGLVHTLSLVYFLCRDTVGVVSRGQEVKEGRGTSIDLVIPSYYILCNNTDVDLIVGQVATDEEMFVPTSTCAGYSWYGHTTLPQKLRFSLTGPTPYQWAEPFSVDSPGVSCVSVPMGLSVARAYVEVTGLGGMQRQVTVYGDWTFFSTLTLPLEMKLTCLSGDDSKEDSLSPPSSPLSSPLTPPSLLSLPLPLSPPFLPTRQPKERVLVIRPEETTPSILAPRGQVGGVFLRALGTERWSKPYPLPYAEGWNKPQLLVELPEDSGKESHFWFNVKSMDGTSGKHWGHRVTFSPLFAICNHLPVDLTMITKDNSPEATPQGLSQITTFLGPSPISPILIGGNGATTTLRTLCADTWYNLSFKMSDTLASSEPPISLSTFLLRHLPISPTSTTLPPSVPDLDASTTQFTLPLDLERSRQCRVRATLLRNNFNTITLHLRAEWVIVNETPLSFDLVEPHPQVIGEEEEEACSIEFGPSLSRLVSQKEIALRLEHAGSPFISNLIILPSLWGKGKSKFPSATADGKKEESEELPSVQVALTPVAVALGLKDQQQEASHDIVGKVLLSYHNLCTSLSATIKPVFVFHNSSPHTVRILPCITKKGVSSSLLPSLTTPHLWEHHPEVSEDVKPGDSRALLFWNLLGSWAPKSVGVTHSLLLSGCPVGDDLSHTALPWSIPLSADYVRHSFSLPVLHMSQAFAACLLTMHESRGITYLVLQEDTAPQICIQNLTSADFQVVECGVSGLSACPQVVPMCHEVVYEPPSLAKLYPVVYDEDIASEKDKRLQKMAKNVKIRLRCGSAPERKSDGDGVGEVNVADWSDAFALTKDEDELLTVPGFGRILVSTDCQSHHTFISLIPTGTSSSLQLTSRLGAMTGRSVSRDLRVNVDASQIVLSLSDDSHSCDQDVEILRFVARDVCFMHSRLVREGAKIDLTVKSLRIDNITVQSSQEFAVVFLPRCEHAAPRQLIKTEFPPLLKLNVHYNPHATFQIASIYVSIQPATFQLEDSLLQKMKHVMVTYAVPTATCSNQTQVAVIGLPSVPVVVLQEAERDAYPVSISSLVIEPVSIFVSVNVTLKAYLSCKDTPFGFPRYELTDVFSNWPEVSQIIAARYMSALFMHIGWVLGSLELIGSPITFIQSVNRGLADLVRLPYEGLTRSPGLFLVGIGQGTASFIHQFSSGALSSITNLASSIARNMERLSMDPDHMTYQDRQRRERPATHFTEGVASGVSSFGLSLMSAVAGLVEQPMQSFQRMDESDSTTSTLLKGFGKGLLGVVTKPVGGAMDLVSKAGQGIMSDAGLSRRLGHCELSDSVREFVQVVEKKDLVKTCGGHSRNLGHYSIVVSCVAQLLCKTGSRQVCVLLLTRDHLSIWDTSSDTLSQELAISSCWISSHQQDSEMELRISTTTLVPNPVNTGDGMGSGLEIVRHYLQQANVDVLEQGFAQEHLPGPEVDAEHKGASTSTAGIVSLHQEPIYEASTLELDTSTHHGTCAPGASGVEEEEEEKKESGLVVCVETGQGVQLLAVFEALRWLHSHPQDMYTVH